MFSTKRDRYEVAGVKCVREIVRNRLEEEGRTQTGVWILFSVLMGSYLRILNREIYMI